MLEYSRTIFATSVFFTIWSLFFIYEDIVTVSTKQENNKFSDFCIEYKLTPREIETGELLIKGLTYEDIGKKLFVSKETVKSHVKNIYQKSSVNSKIQLIGKIDVT